MRCNKRRSRRAIATIFCLAVFAQTMFAIPIAAGQSSGTPAGRSGLETGSATPEYFVMIDPAHGGDDKGAALGGKLVEKDFTLALARQLKKELLARGIEARLVRETDVNLGLERRAEIANENHAGLYVALHVGAPGTGIRVYSSALPPAGVSSGRFLPWENAQAPAVERSRALARIVAPALRKRGLQVAVLASPLRPLNNVTAPAIAVELTPAPFVQESQASSKLRNTVASAIAEGIAQSRGLPGVPFGPTGWNRGVPGASGFASSAWKPRGHP
jgi:N-acetylmuramoyl-L-alanine amidase